MPKFMNLYSFLKMDEHDPNKNGGGGTGGDPNKKPDGDPGGAGGDGAFTDIGKANEEIKRLRGENASRRTANKELDAQLKAFSDTLGKVTKHLGIDEKADPVEVAKQLGEKNSSLELEVSLLQLARAHNIPADQDDYFRFLLSKEFETLKDGEELSDEKIEAVVAKVNAVGAPSNQDGKQNSTGLGNKKGADGKGNPPPAGGDSKKEVTVEQFKKMDVIQKGKLFTENKELYLKLQAESR